MNKVLFVAVHLACFGAIWTGISIASAALCLFLYAVRMFAITAGYHRLFSHRSFETSRVFQFVLALLGTSAAQKGPLWWAAIHRHHHRHSDTEHDLHSPGIQGIWWAHAGWVLSSEYDKIDLSCVRDLAKYPELRLLDKFHYIPPLLLLALVALIGVAAEAYFPGLGASAAEIVVWGAFISTVLTYHSTFAINSFAHLMGTKRFATSDQSRNSLLLALLTFGEGWHNNHHRYPGSERQGFYWWEIDITHYVLVFLSWCGVVWQLRTPPARIYAEAMSPLHVE